MSLGDKLSIKQIVDISDNPLGTELSPLGNASLTIAKNAVSVVSRLSNEQLQNVGEDMASQIMTGAVDLIGEFVSDVATEAANAGLNTFSQAIPIVAQAVGLIAGVVDLLEATEQAKSDALAEFCRLEYTPIPSKPWGSGIGGEAVPANLFAGAVAGPHAGVTPSVVDVIHYGIELPTYGDLKSEKTLTSTFGQKSPYQNITGVPGPIRTRLKEIRHAIYETRNDSYDGGRTLFPVWIDLILAQFRQKRTNLAFVKKMWQGQDECAEVIPQAATDLEGLIHAWKSTAFPIYGLDKTKIAEVIKRAIDRKSKPLILSSHSVEALKKMAGQSKLASPSIKSVLSVAKNLSKKGVQFTAAPPEVGPSLLRRPNKSTGVISDIEQQIIDAAHGIYDSNQAAQDEIASSVADVIPEDVQGLADARALILQAEMGDQCAQDTIEAIAAEAEDGDETAIDTLGYIVAVIDGIEAGTIPPLTDEDIEDFSFCDEVSGVGGPDTGGVIIWKNGVPTTVPSGIRNRGIIINEKAIAQGFDPQPDPPKVGYGYGEGQYFTGGNDNNLPVFGTTYGW